MLPCLCRRKPEFSTAKFSGLAPKEAKFGGQSPKEAKTSGLVYTCTLCSYLHETTKINFSILIVIVYNIVKKYTLFEVVYHLFADLMIQEQGALIPVMNSQSRVLKARLLSFAVAAIESNSDCMAFI